MNNISQQYRASLSRTQGRKSWCVIFQHPLRYAANGKPGLRLRRGLGTEEKAEAETLVAQLNEILADRSLHNPASRGLAASLYDKRIVEAFFGELVPVLRDSWALRDSVIPLPGKDQGYLRALLLGTTGVGKTTLVRQLLGTNPERERFPSTSPARTTICDLEAVISPGSFQAVVSFISRELTVQHVEDNLLATITAIIEGRQESELRRRLLTHVEQRFRLQYILGRVVDDTDEDILEDEDEELIADEEKSEITDAERKSYSDRILAWLERLRKIEKRLLADAESENKLNFQKATAQEKEFLIEWVEEGAPEDSELRETLDEIVAEIESRFDFLNIGTLERDSGDWPTSWTWESGDRAAFIKAINRFSSNWAPNFGRLLTPLVDGIRVSGPFTPDWIEGSPPQLVLMDGQGLGHTLDSAASVSTRITKRYDSADVILLVDTAAQPMQAAPFEVLKSVVSSGQEAKLAICFTHFDDVKGDNLTNAAAKRSHVLGSLENAIAEVGKVLGRHAEVAIRAGVDGRVFFVSNIQKTLSEKAQATRAELNKLVRTVAAAKSPIESKDVSPVYDIANLVLVLQKALIDFHQPWAARLGLSVDSKVPREAWQRIKALSKRLGVFGVDEYDSLRPVADLNKHLREGLLGFVADPVRWEPSSEIAEGVRLAKLAEIARLLADRLQALSSQRILIERATDWSSAYNLRGLGSTTSRAQRIRAIYDLSAPIPTPKADLPTTEFLNALKTLVREAIETAGGKLL